MSLFLSCYSLHLSIKIKIQHYCNCTLYDLIHSKVVKRPQRHETTTKIANEFSSKSYIIAYYLLKKHCSCVKHYHLPIQLSQMLQIRKQYIPKTISHSNWNRVSFDNQFFNLDTYSLTDWLLIRYVILTSSTITYFYWNHYKTTTTTILYCTIQPPSCTFIFSHVLSTIPPISEIRFHQNHHETHD